MLTEKIFDTSERKLCIEGLEGPAGASLDNFFPHSWNSKSLVVNANIRQLAFSFVV